MGREATRRDACNQIRKRLTYANVMSTIAAFLALGGAAAFAATNLPANSVGTGQLQKNAVRTGKIAPEAVRAGKLAKNAVTTDRLREGSVATKSIAKLAVNAGRLANLGVTTGKLANEAVGTGKLGSEAVTTGKLGSEAVNNGRLANNAVNNGKLADNAVTSNKIQDGQVLAADLGPINVKTAVATESKTGSIQVAVSCGSGERLISGGGLWSGSNTTDAQLRASFPSGNNWVAQGNNNSGGPLDFTAYALCLQG